ncbi:MAG: 50S ribosomal protein L21 [Alphaproteobacteria bacterium]|nr:50S ribosomal protein L21 [Alphaproteobacteria bacterium]
MYAVIKTGGKQYRVAADQKIQIEKLAGSPGDQVEFTDVLMVSNGGTIDIGAPFVAGATVVGEIASQDRGPHITIFKKRRRKHYRRKNGHRQDLTSVTIREILMGGAKPAKKAAAPKKETAPVAAAATLASGLAEGVSPDDISLIGGIGPKFQKGLKGMGITTLAQIAGWTEADVERVETELNAKGRVAREEWIEQAKELLDGKPPRAKTDRARAKDQE